MTKYIIKRFFLMILVWFIIVSIAFIGTKMAQYAIWSFPHPIIIDFKRAVADYQIYMKGVLLHNDWGVSRDSIDIWSMALERGPITLKINFYALLFYVPFGIFLGLVCSYYKGSIFDKIVSNVTLVLSGIPSYIMMFFLLVVFGYKLRWFPALYDPYPDTIIEFIKGITLPVVALTLVPLSHTIRMVKGELEEEMESEYVILLKAKGLSRWQSMRIHALRNAMIPVIQDMVFQFGIILSMSFIIEMTYNIHGIAYLFFQSMIVPSIDGNYLNIDTPVATMTTAFYAAFVLIVGLVSDILLPLFDPRINITGKKV